VTAQRKALDETNEDFCKAPLSQVIRMAVEDLTAVEADPKHIVHMPSWHAPLARLKERDLARYRQLVGAKTEAECAVCLAGSVLANRLGADPKRSIWPDTQAAALRRRLVALNDVRLGNFGGAAGQMGKNWQRAREATKGIYVPEYSPEQSSAFKSALLQAADALEKAGL
jgi:hypothetical protein